MSASVHHPSVSRVPPALCPTSADRLPTLLESSTSRPHVAEPTALAQHPPGTRKPELIPDWRQHRQPSAQSFRRTFLLRSAAAGSRRDALPPLSPLGTGLLRDGPLPA